MKIFLYEIADERNGRWSRAKRSLNRNLKYRWNDGEVDLLGKIVFYITLCFENTANKNKIIFDLSPSLTSQRNISEQQILLSSSWLSITIAFLFQWSYGIHLNFFVSRRASQTMLALEKLNPVHPNDKCASQPRFSLSPNCFNDDKWKLSRQKAPMASAP